MGGVGHVTDLLWRVSVPPGEAGWQPVPIGPYWPRRRIAMKAMWNDTLIAESDDIVTVEGNAYFPETALDKALLKPSSHTSVCPWKGTANYYSLDVGGTVNENAVWYYAEPKEAAKEIKGRVAFWKGVKVG
jgi:uncharacterized protein (DUF427 family)